MLELAQLLVNAHISQDNSRAAALDACTYLTYHHEELFQSPGHHAPHCKTNLQLAFETTNPLILEALENAKTHYTIGNMPTFSAFPAPLQWKDSSLTKALILWFLFHNPVWSYYVRVEKDTAIRLLTQWRFTPEERDIVDIPLLNFIDKFTLNTSDLRNILAWRLTNKILSQPTLTAITHLVRHSIATYPELVLSMLWEEMVGNQRLTQALLWFIALDPTLLDDLPPIPERNDHTNHIYKRIQSAHGKLEVLSCIQQTTQLENATVKTLCATLHRAFPKPKNML